MCHQAQSILRCLDDVVLLEGFIVFILLDFLTIDQLNGCFNSGCVAS